MLGPPPKSSGRQHRFKTREKKTFVRLVVAGPGGDIVRESIPICFWMDVGRLLIDLGVDLDGLLVALL